MPWPPYVGAQRMRQAHPWPACWRHRVASIVTQPWLNGETDGSVRFRTSATGSVWPVLDEDIPYPKQTASGRRQPCALVVAPVIRGADRRRVFTPGLVETGSDGILCQ